MKPSELIRENEELYKKLKDEVQKMSENEILDLMIENPELIQRPIVEIGDRAILARPAERLKELFD